MVERAEEIRLQGQGVSSGIAIGRPFHYHSPDEGVKKASQPLSQSQVSREITRYRSALQHARDNLQTLIERLRADGVEEGVEIFDAQLQMMDDPFFTEGVEEEIRRSCQGADTAFWAVIQQCEQQFKSLPDPTLRDRYGDIEDVARRVLRYLRRAERSALAHAPEGSVVFAHELMASDAAEALEGAMAGLVTEKGSMTSHAAIVARAGQVPFVTHIEPGCLNRVGKDLVVIDGATGEVILNPSKATLAHYRKLQGQLAMRHAELLETRRMKAETYDGYEVRLSANLELEGDLEALQRYGGLGIGLFRSEYLMLAHNRFPSEAEQFICYRRIVRQMRGLPVVIRAFDVGGDKMPRGSELRKEANPYLGWRAIRFLLREPQIFETQLRAILRASAYGDVGILFPLVSALQELLDAKALLNRVRQNLVDEGEPVAERVRIGCMIEVPSAAIISDVLARECDFLSIGTNDLVQYCLAVDRGNPTLSAHYTPTHPSVLRLIRLVVSEANRVGIPVSVCGEMAADPQYVPLLLGLGVHELSVSPRHLPIIKNAIRHLSIVEAVRIAEQALSRTTASEVLELLATSQSHPHPVA